MAVKIARRTLPATYFALVKLFPLTHIRDDAHLNAAQKKIDQLLEANLDEGARSTWMP